MSRSHRETLCRADGQDHGLSDIAWRRAMSVLRLADGNRRLSPRPLRLRSGRRQSGHRSGSERLETIFDNSLGLPRPTGGFDALQDSDGGGMDVLQAGERYCTNGAYRAPISKQHLFAVTTKTLLRVIFPGCSSPAAADHSLKTPVWGHGGPDYRLGHRIRAASPLSS